MFPVGRRQVLLLWLGVGVSRPKRRWQGRHHAVFEEKSVGAARRSCPLGQPIAHTVLVKADLARVRSTTTHYPLSEKVEYFTGKFFVFWLRNNLPPVLVFVRHITNLDLNSHNGTF